ncbi:MAG: S-layer homology domain-containing protein [Clostridia bacterium]|nr:S-layer homology domain-containing protein [Clostridia bacterium]
MKKTFKLLLCVSVLTLLFSAIVNAETVKFEEDYVTGDEIVVASFNGVKPFIANLANPEPLEDACYWLSEIADAYNIKYVSFVGKTSSPTTEMWSKYQDTTKAIAANEVDQPRIDEFEKLKSVSKILQRVKIPYGVSLHTEDYFGKGLSRRNHVDTVFTIDDFTGRSDCRVEFLDINNFAVIVEEGDQKYIIYQLEAYPRLAVINWFNGLNALHQDKRAIVYTTSFASAKGDLYTQYDPTKYTYFTAPSRGTMTLTTNMVSDGRPFEGEQIWKQALGKWNNVLVIVSSNADVKKNIVTTKLENENGYEAVSIVANLADGYGSIGAYPLFIKLSEDHKNIDIRYAVPYFEKEGGYVAESVTTIEIKKLAPLAESDPVQDLEKIEPQLNGENKAYIKGYEDSTFKPNANMTKAEASVIFARLLAGSDEMPKGLTTRFVDVTPDKWYYDEIAYLDTNGYYFSTEGDKYNPDALITRGEFVELAYFASNIISTEDIKFKDVKEGDKYYDAIMAAASTGLVNGYSGKLFKPEANITRAEVVTIVNRILNLTANNNTVSKENTKSVFTDTDGHWAEYQILMASNDNVNCDAFYNIPNDLFTEDASTITFGNSQLEITIKKKDGQVEKAIYVPTGENVLAVSASPWFSYVVSNNGATLQPTNVEIVDGKLKFSYKGGYTAYFIIEMFEHHFTMELVSNISSDLKSVVFANIDFDYTASLTDPESFRASGVSMDTKADCTYWPGGWNSITRAQAFSSIGVDLIGAKLGVTFSKEKDHRTFLKEITDSIDRSRGLSSTAGGAYALDTDDLFTDYVIVSSSINEENATELAKLAKEYSIDFLDYHQGYNTFYQGTFNFQGSKNDSDPYGAFIDAKTFKERVVDKVHAEGVKMALHTYSSTVYPVGSAVYWNENPEYLYDIEYAETTYTLRDDLSKYKTSVKTYEDASSFSGAAGGTSYYNDYSSYILIDYEIIKVTTGTTSGFIRCQRGQLGTEATKHEDGAEIRQLMTGYAFFQPICGSDLWYRVADETAKAYNEGNFDMIYLDGFESMYKYVPTEQLYYYYGEFVRRIFEQVETDPIVEYSTNDETLWAARGRGGAIDHANRAYKEFKQNHLEDHLLAFEQRYYTATLGWMAYAPDRAQTYKNTVIKTLFRDDMDHMGSIGIARDYSTVCQPFSVDAFKNYPMLAENFMYYSAYSRLRKGGYFAEEVKDALIASEYEHRLIEQNDGTYAFVEMYYNKHKILDMTDKLFITGTGNNPFQSQTPFVRIEQRYSTLSENELLVIAFDENAEVSTLAAKHTIPVTDLSKHQAMKINVYGNGEGGEAGLLITIRGNGSGGGRTDFYIPVSHNGWREFILIDADNDDYPGSNFEGDPRGSLYANDSGYRATNELATTSSVQVTVRGNVEGVKIDDLRAYTITDAYVKNPSVTIGNTQITFNTELHSGEYIEYYPDFGKAYRTYYPEVADLRREEVSFTGDITVPAGTFTYTYDAEAQTEAPTRAQVVIGVAGQIITNPEGFTPPEIDMPEGILDVKLR